MRSILLASAGLCSLTFACSSGDGSGSASGASVPPAMGGSASAAAGQAGMGGTLASNAIVASVEDDNDPATQINKTVGHYALGDEIT